MISPEIRPKICMFVMNRVVTDARVLREAETLANNGYDVAVVGLGGDRSEDFINKGIRVVLLKIPLIYRFAMDKKKKKSVKEMERHSSPGVEKDAAFFRRAMIFLKKMINDIGEISYVLSANIAMASAGRKLKADVYHSHDLNTLLAGYLSSRITKAKLVYDFHEAYIEQFPPGTYTRIWRFVYSFLEKILIKKSDRLITVCDSLRNWAVENYGISGVAVIMNVSRYIRPDMRSEKHGGKIVLYQGIYMKDRGLEQLIESVKYFNPGIKLILRGKGVIDDYLRQIVKDENLEDRVEFAPPVKMEELVKYASEADIGVIPYIATNLNNKFTTPNKLFEYMTAGLAIAGSDLPELRNIIIGNNLGRLFNPTDPKGIAKVINEILSDEVLLSGLKNNSLKAARDKYNWEKESRKLITLYEKLCNV